MKPMSSFLTEMFTHLHHDLEDFQEKTNKDKKVTLSYSLVVNSDPYPFTFCLQFLLPSFYTISNSSRPLPYLTPLTYTNDPSWLLCEIPSLGVTFHSCPQWPKNEQTNKNKKVEIGVSRYETPDLHLIFLFPPQFLLMFQKWTSLTSYHNSKDWGLYEILTQTSFQSLRTSTHTF